jgi:type IV pilus assembly protein PilC
MVKYWWALLVVALLLFLGFRYYRSTEKGKRNLDKLVLKIPIVGKLIIKTQIAQFTRILGLLLSSGLSIVKALELTGESLSNSIFRDVVMDARDEVEKGGPLAIPIARSEYFPLLVSSMISVGEETGEIDAVLDKVSQYYKEEVDVATSNLSTILEPFLLILMGGAVAFIALGVYMPMFGLAQAMG